MGRKIFISYKYGDELVENIQGVYNTSVRDYIDIFQALLEETDEINKGEADDEDLSDFKDSTIASNLRDKIYDSSITVAFISRGMKENILENDQWMPWEVSYSLKEHSRGGRTSKSNAVIAVAIPDENRSYEYYIKDESCSHCHSRTIMTNHLFQILSKNMFNIKNPEFVDCEYHSPGSKPYKGYSSYIHSVKWSDFIADPIKFLDIAVYINDNIDNYEITKQID